MLTKFSDREQQRNMENNFGEAGDKIEEEAIYRTRAICAFS